MIKITVDLSNATEEEMECYNSSRLCEVIRSGRAVEFKNDGNTHLEILSVSPVMDGRTGKYQFSAE